MRIVLAFLLVLSAITLAPASAIDTAPAPCPVAEFISGVQVFHAPAGSYVRVTFRVDQPTTVVAWGAVSWHAATSSVVAAPHTFPVSAERAAIVDTMQRADGTPLYQPGGFLAYPHGMQATGPVGSVRVHLQDSGVCGTAAAPTPFDLEPGTYSYTVLAASDTPNAGAAFLPRGLAIDRVELGPLTIINEASLACAARATFMAAGVSHTSLLLCRQDLPASGQGLHGIFVGRYTDSTHLVDWVTTEGDARAVAFYDSGIEPPGTATLFVPRYVTAAGHAFNLPTPGALGSDSGIFGMFADIA